MPDRYEIRSQSDFQEFEFISEGPNGKVKKVVIYAETGVEGIYSLGFGDKDVVTDELNDLTVTNNGDSRKVLATVAQTLFLFTDMHPGAEVYATGSTATRTRLYRIGITNNLEIIEADFIVSGLSGSHFVPFSKGVDYDGFLVRRKL